MGARTTTGGVVVGLGLLLASAPPPQVAAAELVQATQLAGAGAGTDPTGPLVAALALLAWALTAWLALTVSLVLLSRLPGALGRTVQPAGLARRPCRRPPCRRGGPGPDRRRRRPRSRRPPSPLLRRLPR